MFSLESFYSVLYSNLLRPANFYYQYFYPFGSTNPNDLIDFSHIYSDNNSVFASSGGRHKCIAWDQEPLIEDLVLQNHHLNLNFSTRHCNIFANSERSLFKNKFLQDAKYLNWYYFFHGFAALDWYKNFQYFHCDDNFSKSFISLNRLWQDDRNYRLELVSKLKNSNVLEHGTVSLHVDSFDQIKKELVKPNSKLSINSKKLIFNSMNNQILPIVADRSEIPGMASALGSYEDLKFNKSALLHVVSETVFYYDKLHLTEKIFKPIVSKRPFILVGATGNLKYLRDYGFQTFDRWIDESYDTIDDNSNRINAIVEQVTRISSMDSTRLKKMYNEMKEILDYNYNHFYNGKFRYLIAKELVDNFKGCCVAWNQNVCRENDQVAVWNVDFDKALSNLIR